jgi:hypothetical protein
VAILTAAWRLRELADEAAAVDDPGPFVRAEAAEWVGRASCWLGD